MKILHLNLIESKVDVSELVEKLSMMKVETSISNDLGFCPHFIMVVNQEDGSIFADNTNDGHFSGLKRKHEIDECSDLIEFIEKAGEMLESANLKRRSNKTEVKSNALF